MGTLDLTQEVIDAREGESSLDARIDTLKLVDCVTAEFSSVLVGGAIIPYDDTFPQNIEGFTLPPLFISHAMRSASNFLIIEANIFMSHDTGGILQVAVFNDTVGVTADAIASGVGPVHAPDVPIMVPAFKEFLPATTALILYGIQVGCDIGGTTTVNGSGGVRRHGGSLFSRLKIWEYRT